MASILNLINSLGVAPQAFYESGTPQMQPEPNRVSAPVVPDAGPSTAVPASDAPRTSKKPGGVLGALQSIFMPDAGSLWASALRNGIWDAKAGQQEYQQGLVNNQLKAETVRATNAQTLANARKDELRARYGIAGNNVVDYGDGSAPPTIIQAPTTPSENERLIDRWHSTPAGPERDLIERAIRGFQYTPQVINTQADARTRTAVAGAAARGAQARMTKATPGAAARGGSRAKTAPKPPAGFVLD